MSQMIIVDVWGGVNSADHIARFILSLEEALVLAKHELANGFLVNLRKEMMWGTYHNFDTRF